MSWNYSNLQIKITENNSFKIHNNDVYPLTEPAVMPETICFSAKK